MQYNKNGKIRKCHNNKIWVIKYEENRKFIFITISGKLITGFTEFIKKSK